MSNPSPNAQMVDLVTVNIDGVDLQVPKGTLIIRAAEQLGVSVPRFCDHPSLDPVAACRACLVEIEGQAKPQPACAIPVADGMRVKTQNTSEIASDAQKGVMEFLLLNHPLDCPVCDKGGECPLQNQAMEVGRSESRFEGEKRDFEKPVSLSSQVLLDRERCVSCARCTRFAEQIAGDPLISLQQRGAQQVVGISDDQPFDSYYSGNTIQICPVGALTSSKYRFRSRPFDLVSVPTVCEHCASGCALRTDVRRGVVQRRLAWDDPQVNEEFNCDKGRFAFTYLEEGRLTHPLVRGEDGELHVSSWPEAIAAAAAGLANARGGRAAVLAGGRHTVEDAYAISKFARAVLGTDDIDFRARPNSNEEREFLAAAIAGTGIGVTYADLESAKHVVLVALEPEDESPMIQLRLRKAIQRNRTKVSVVASHLSIGAAKLEAELIAVKAGDELAGLQRAGVTSDSIILVGERAASVAGLLSGILDLVEATSAKLAWVPRRAGERGSLDAGLLAGLLPGGRSLTDPAARSAAAAIWSVEESSIPNQVGRTFDEIVEAASADAYAALVVTGFDPEDTSYPAATLAAIQRAPFVVALELNGTVVTSIADVVFPVAAVTEKAGAFVDWEGRTRTFTQALRDTNTMTDARVLGMIADALDVFVGRQDVKTLRAELQKFIEVPVNRSERPRVASGPVAQSATLETWPQLLDSGVMQAGEPYLAGTARSAVAKISAAKASSLRLKDGDFVRVSASRGSVLLPFEIVEGVEDSVWIPTNSEMSQVRAALGASHGAEVSISHGGAE
jgi:NADH-quinone oxidoreductase subunit G